VAHAVLDLSAAAKWAQGFAGPEDADNFFRMRTGGDWGVEKRLGQLVLLRKGAPELPKLFRKIDEPDLPGAPPASYGGVVRLLGAGAEREELAGFVQVRVRTAWELLGKPQVRNPQTGEIADDRLLIDFALFDQSGAMVWSAGGGSLEAPRPMAALDNFALCPSVWQAGERFEVEHAILVPDSVPVGTYRLGLLVASWRAGMVLPPSGQVLGDRYCHIMNITLLSGSEP
jgi:hypothetical protein